MAVQSHDPSLYEHRDLIEVKRALISVSDKTKLLDLAAALAAAGVEIVSTGSTAATIREAGHPVTDVAEVTGFAEALDGRVKTLHPAVHSGLLADLRLADHRAQLEQLGFAPFELVVVNLYPFEQTVAAGKPAADIVENVDIGGPAMVRATAKNHANAAIVVSPGRYDEVISAIQAGGTTLALRRSLATEAFVHTAQYDGAVANWFLDQQDAGWEDAPAAAELDAPEEDEVAAIFATSEGYVGYEVFGLRESVLRYGENSHQRAALFSENEGVGIAQATQLHGKEMSYNNYVDADAALRAAFDHERPAVAIIKHANPCGVAVAPEGAADPIAAAHELAHACDPVSAFGGVIAANRVVTEAMAKTVSEIFTEVIIAPGFEPEALAILAQKKNVRLLVLPEGYAQNPVELKQVSGGFLIQDADRHFAPAAEWTLAAGEPADAETLAELEFAWRASRAVKSNGILLTNGGASVGVGMGQVNRVDSCRLAVSRAGERAAGAVAASDAFFPFADGLQVLLDAGVRAVVQPGGSVRDEEVIAAAQAAGVTMYFTGERHFFH
ncbi:bifunctional phosphoribosylaminoimidazolecarboxamide formyltransferase/IMP cyclohydrolase [Leucobacter aridicollis]|uniref:Bifunctional purine biosynthesis protein PurH n=1 Tax=Leucobacter aridicollis TaxID=283878 RepID=A0A852R747_9MICO|nr:bifunctional phosphoribosylaminoimidazolecarboxamide formyltransferase/IMP cyclohydrolase [Leucobacter aridicollis]MBL3682811.1 bifunctional phosphoribosylaminoimidazolecarboxamide formyltransferase/IMP cyclohydrolase PurH [Leucobacter aridicollis]NYD26249.1 phosphoribosylaminoimidazolecarboxamide formyltransferase/IMP cyclohydrolase [Leucobacter aridicollis]